MATLLRPYQAEGERQIFAAWKEGHRNIFYQLCTGGGKTVLFVNIIRKFLAAGKRVVLVAHREELITQAWNTLYKNEIFAGIIKADVAPNYSLPCQVCSIQTLARRSKLPPADLFIIDEAHHSQDDNSYGNVIVDHFSNARVLGVSATPYRLNGAGFRKLYEVLVCGPTFRELVSWGYLTPLRYFVASRPDLTNVSISKGDYTIEEAAGVMKLAPLVESYIEYCAGMCGLCFAVNVDHSQQIVRQYNAAGISAAHVDANTHPEERRRIFKALADRKLNVVVNVGIATEGTDIPNIDFVQLARPTKSLALFLQMVGRVTRPIWADIKDATNDEERAAMLAAGSKPYGYVLDNAGLWEEHGLPDQEFNWVRHFQGIPKKKKGEVEQIEIIEFVAEDASGKRLVTNIPSEVEGLKLIEVNKRIKDRIVNITALKEFDKQIALFDALSKKPNSRVKKVGYLAYSAFKDYCRKNNYEMSPEVWEYLIKKLVEEPDVEESRLLSYQDRTIEAINTQYYGSEDVADRENLITKLREQVAKSIAKVEARRVSEQLIKRERANYFKAGEVAHV
jgi:superfamily II DNA or RNA helicase